MINMLTVGRILLVLGFLIGWESLYQTFSHIGDERFLISPDHPGGETHAWYHCLRELMGDIGTMVAVLLVFFCSANWRVPATWWLCLVVLIGYYSPFWIGIPFNDALAAPDLEAEIRHIIQAVLPLSALFVARAEFFKERK